MDWVSVSQTAIAFLKKYRYVMIVLLVGLLLMSMPQSKDSTLISATAETSPKTPDLSVALEEILSQIQGVGNVKVLLTLAAGPETVYQQKEELPLGTESGTIRREPVIINDAQREQNGLVRMELGPQYLGAIVLCQGADSAVIRLAIVDAVSKATGLATNCISVLKMK